jgi:hypothetical protein
LERHLLNKELGELIERSATMKRLLYPLLAIALVPQVPAAAQPPHEHHQHKYQYHQPKHQYHQPTYHVPYLAAAIADGTQFQVKLHPGENNGTLIGGETYFGHYNPDSNTFTLSGLGRRPEDGVVIPVTATYGGADPLRQELSLWGALYTFDIKGNLFLGTGGRLAGKVWLQK